MTTLLLSFLMPATLLAAEPAATPTDFRGRVVLAYGLVVAVIVLFVAWARSRDRRTLEDVEDLEERVEKLERDPGARDPS